MSIRKVFRDAVNDPQPVEKEVVKEAKGRSKRKNKSKNKKKKSKNKAAHDRVDNAHLPPATKTEQPATVKAKDRTGKAAQKAKQDLQNYDESVSDESLAETLMEDLFDDMDFSEGFEFNEQAVNLLKKACMAGFMSSTNESNGKNCRAIYKNSALQTGAEVWNKNLREKFNRFLYNEKKKINEGKK